MDSECYRSYYCEIVVAAVCSAVNLASDETCRNHESVFAWFSHLVGQGNVELCTIHCVVLDRSHDVVALLELHCSHRCGVELTCSFCVESDLDVFDRFNTIAWRYAECFEFYLSRIAVHTVESKYAATWECHSQCLVDIDFSTFCQTRESVLYLERLVQYDATCDVCRDVECFTQCECISL